MMANPTKFSYVGTTTDFSHLGTTAEPCHPERSLAESEANHQTQSKDPYRAEAAGFKAGNFRIVVRFFDQDKTEHLPVSSREAAAYESPSRKCRFITGNTNTSRGDASDATKRP